MPYNIYKPAEGHIKIKIQYTLSISANISSECASCPFFLRTDKNPVFVHNLGSANRETNRKWLGPRHTRFLQPITGRGEVGEDVGVITSVVALAMHVYKFGSRSSEGALKGRVWRVSSNITHLSPESVSLTLMQLVTEKKQNAMCYKVLTPSVGKC